MNKKLQTIQTLKDKLHSIQNHLQKITKQQTYQESLKNYTSVTTSPKFNSTINKQYRNPTFWSGNPILGKQNVSIKTSHYQHRQRNKEKIPICVQLGKISQNIGESYYIPSKKQDLSYSAQKERQIREKRHYSHRKDKSLSPSLDHRGQTPRFEKIRTYQRQITNPILNPNPQKTIGKKIVKKNIKSPQNPFTENPLSQPLLYFNNSQPIYLSSSNKLTNTKNTSPNMKDLLNSSQESIQKTKRKKSAGKKHYPRYFQQNFGSRWI